MKIQPREPHSEAQPKIKSDFVDSLFFIALNILVVPFSAYQTYFGYKKDVADDNIIIALVVALISGVLFAAMNFGIRKDRLDGKRHALKVLMYIVPIGLSFPGNFNAFYSNQMKRNLLQTEINAYRLVLTSTKDIAVAELENSIDLINLKLNYNTKKQALQTEFDSLPSGWGKNCNALWANLCNFLNSEGGTISTATINSIRDENQKIKKALAFADADLAAIVGSRSNKIEPSLNIILSTYSTCDRYVDSLLSLPNPVYNSATLDKIVTAENFIRSTAQPVLDRTDVFPHEELKPSFENELGTIKHSFNSAFVKKDNPTAMVFSLFLSLIIDFAALLYILVFIPFNAGKKKGGRIGPQTI